MIKLTSEQNSNRAYRICITIEVEASPMKIPLEGSLHREDERVLQLMEKANQLYEQYLQLNTLAPNSRPPSRDSLDVAGTPPLTLVIETEG